MERSSQDPSIRTVRPVHPKNLKKINAADANFLMWFQGQQPALSLDEGKKQYVDEVNVRRKAKYTKYLEEYQGYLDSLKDMGPIPNPAASEHSPPHSRLTTLSKSTIKNRSPPQNIFSQSFPSQNNLPQNISPQNSPSQNNLPQNISPQNSLSQNVSVLPPTPENSSRVIVVPSPITPRLSDAEDLEAIRAMLMEGMQVKSTKAADKEETVEVLSVEGVGERTQPLSFLTLNTVEPKELLVAPILLSFLNSPHGRQRLKRLCV
jgi:hypothetical protein